MIDEVLNAIILADVQIPSVARRIAAIRGIFYRHQLGCAASCWQIKHSLIDDSRSFVPICMEWEQGPIVIVDEGGINLGFHSVGLRAEVGAYIGGRDRLAIFVCALVRDLVGLGLPLPLV